MHFLKSCKIQCIYLSITSFLNIYLQKKLHRCKETTFNKIRVIWGCILEVYICFYRSIWVWPPSFLMMKTVNSVRLKCFPRAKINSLRYESVFNHIELEFPSLWWHTFVTVIRFCRLVDLWCKKLMYLCWKQLLTRY